MIFEMGDNGLLDYYKLSCTRERSGITDAEIGDGYTALCHGVVRLGK